MPNLAGLDRLQSQLLTSGLQQKDQPLYQVISQLIGFVRQFVNETGAVLDPSGGGTPFSQSFATVDPEQASLPFSRQLVAGPGIQFNDQFTKLVISGTPIPGSGGEPGDEGPMGMIGPQGPRGPAGVSAAGSMPYFWNDSEDDNVEYPPLFTLLNANAIPEVAIQDGDILARLAGNEIVTGNWTFSNTTPQFLFFETDAGVDEKYWRFVVAGGGFFLQTVNDAFNATDLLFITTRLGVTIQTFALLTNTVQRTDWASNGTLNHAFGLRLSGQAAAALAADQTAWNPTGLGTSFFITITNASPFNIRGITAQAAGTIVTFYFASASSVSFFHEDGAATPANRITLTAGVSIGTSQFSVLQFYYDGTGSRWRLVSRSS